MLPTWIALPEGWNRNFESSVTASCRACSSTQASAASQVLTNFLTVILAARNCSGKHSTGTTARTLTARLCVLGKLTSVFLLGQNDMMCDYGHLIFRAVKS